MKLRIRNVAKIEEADLELNGITVIAGNNNTGKSTVGKTVFALYNSLVNLDEKLDRQKEELIYKLLRRTEEDMLLQNDEYFGAFRVSPSRLKGYARELNIRSTAEEQRMILRGYLNVPGKRGPEQEKLLDNIMDEIEKINQLPVERLTKSAISVYFSDIFYSEINSIYQPSKEALIEAETGNKIISIIFENNSCSRLLQQVKILNEAVYLDNPFILDFLNNSASGLDEIEKNTVKKLQKTADAMDEIVRQKLIEDKLKEVMQKIDQVSSGSILVDEGRNYYYKERGINERLNVNNLSAGLKSFVIIKTLLENGTLKQKDVLILDEPEIHLHPDWQLRYAEIIILLQKEFELTIIITTHSSHFMEALQYFAELYGQKEKCTYYLSEKSEFGCKIKAVTDGQTEIYSQLVEAGILLDRLKFELEEAKDE